MHSIIFLRTYYNYSRRNIKAILLTSYRYVPYSLWTLAARNNNLSSDQCWMPGSLRVNCVDTLTTEHVMIKHYVRTKTGHFI